MKGKEDARGGRLDDSLAFRECDEALDARTPIRQGDVLRLIPEEPPWDRYAVVVTADCDIAHQKHFGSLTVVPLLHHEHYLTMFVSPAKIDRVRDRLRGETRSLLRTMIADCTERSLPRDAALDAWIDADAPRAILDHVGAASHAGAGRFEACASWLRNSQRVLASLELEEHLQHIEEGRLLSQPSAARGAVRTKARQEHSSRLTSLPGDAMFISGLNAGSCEGYVAYLRRLTNIPQEAVATTMQDANSADCRALRISRLRSPYVFRLTQMLGTVFSSIGLPNEYEAKRQEFVDSLQGAPT